MYYELLTFITCNQLAWLALHNQLKGTNLNWRDKHDGIETKTLCSTVIEWRFRVTSCDNITRLGARTGEIQRQLSLRSWPLLSFLYSFTDLACSRLQGSNVQRSLELMRKTRGSGKRGGADAPFPDPMRPIFAWHVCAASLLYENLAHIIPGQK